jgi:glycosyltransferase involved in cell wall biosynthesis
VRILVVQESDWIERGPHQSHHLLERMVLRGHQVRVIDFEIGWRGNRAHGILVRRKVLTSSPKVIDGSSIGVVRPAAVRLPILEYASLIVSHGLEIRRQIAEFRPDVILGFGLLNAFAGIRQARQANIPFVYYLIDELHRLVPQPTFRGFARVLEQSNVRRASLVLSINQALRDYAVDMGAPPERAKVLPAGVDLERYLRAGDGTEIRNRNGLQAGDLVLFFMGWVYPFSGLLEVAESLIEDVGTEGRVKLLVVGKGDSWKQMARLVSERNAENRIKMVDFRPYDEIPSYLASADVCVLPAHDTETMRNIVPIKMYEYLAAGKPVIATRLSGVFREFGEDHGVVYVDSPQQVVSLAARLDKEGALGNLGEQGRLFVSKNDWKVTAERFESELSTLVRAQAAKGSSELHPRM